MPTPVVMPQMGESIAEGTIVRWIKKPGDRVDRDEPLFEISTDKVDAEIPSPAAGVLIDIQVKEGETVAVDTVVATIAEPEEAAALAAASAAPKAGTARTAAPARNPASNPGPDAAPAPAAAAAAPAGEPASHDDERRQKSSPLVRRIAKEHSVDLHQVSGSGIGGRVTKTDILGFIEGHPVDQPPAAAGAAGGAEARPVPAYKPGDAVEIKPLSIVRKKIAEHMVLSRRTSAHVHTVFHVNFSAIDRIRQARKGDYERAGTKLTYMAFIAKAVVDALRKYPIVNASLDGTNVVYKKDVNLGIAVALESGLIVPVIKQAGEKNLLGLSKAILDVAERARAKQLKPEEVHGGTFTITNPGQLGAQFGLPIINQPQVAILGVGTVEKRPIVIDDAIAIRTMAYLTLGFDHRLIDGALADQFMAEITHDLEHFDPAQV